MKSILDYKDQVYDHYQKGTERGLDTGLKCINDLISFKKGFTTYIVGFPKSGKTELHLEILFNLTEKHGCKHALMSTEIGGAVQIIGELVSKYLRKPFYKSNPYSAKDSELFEAMNYLSQYFFIVDGEQKDYTVAEFYKTCSDIERAHGIKLDTTSIDPFNDIEDELEEKHGGKINRFLKKELKNVYRQAQKNNWHNFIVTHASSMPPLQLESENGGKVFCTAIPTLQGFEGGQVWSRRAYNVIGMWRPEHGAINPENGFKFEDGEAIMLVLKAKPKGVGTTGRTSIYFDWKVNRYFEKYNGSKMYAGDYERYEKNAMMPISHEFEL